MTLAALRTHTANLWAKPIDAAQRLYASARAKIVHAGRVTEPQLRRAVRVTRRTLRNGLAPVERTLLSAKGREGVHATAVFALIFAFAVTGVDFVLTGGPDFGSSPQQRIASAAPVSLIAAAPTAAAAATQSQQEASIETAAPVTEALEAGHVVPLSSLQSTALAAPERTPAPAREQRSMFTPIDHTLVAPADEPAAAEAPAETSDAPAPARQRHKKPH